jgi:hypothetical protein
MMRQRRASPSAAMDVQLQYPLIVLESACVLNLPDVAPPAAACPCYLQTRASVGWCEGPVVTAVMSGKVPATEPGISALLARFAAHDSSGGGGGGGPVAGAGGAGGIPPPADAPLASV